MSLDNTKTTANASGPVADVIISISLPLN